LRTAYVLAADGVAHGASAALAPQQHAGSDAQRTRLTAAQAAEEKKRLLTALQAATDLTQIKSLEQELEALASSVQ
jgi:hypothetical protein